MYRWNHVAVEKWKAEVAKTKEVVEEVVEVFLRHTIFIQITFLNGLSTRIFIQQRFMKCLILGTFGGRGGRGPAPMGRGGGGQKTKLKNWYN